MVMIGRHVQGGVQSFVSITQLRVLRERSKVYCRGGTEHLNIHYP